MPRCSLQLRGGGASYQRVLRRSSCSWQRSKVHARARVRLRSPAACLRAARSLSLHHIPLIHTLRSRSVQLVAGINPRTALNGPTVGSHFLRVEAIIGLPSICRPRGVGPGGRRGAKERITI